MTTRSALSIHMRRVIRNVVTGGARLGAAFGVVVGSAGLVIGVGLSDRYGWSQVVAWVPREVFLAVLGISLGVVAGLGVRAARGRRRDGAARRRHGRESAISTAWPRGPNMRRWDI